MQVNFMQSFFLLQKTNLSLNFIWQERVGRGFFLNISNLLARQVTLNMKYTCISDDIIVFII